MCEEASASESHSTTENTEKLVFLKKITENFPVDMGRELAWKGGCVYGEIELESLLEILDLSRKQYSLGHGGVFYDLGSGIGKAVIAASLFHTFDACIGIELVSELHDLALNLKNYFELEKSKHPWTNQNITMVNGDICQYNWSDARCFFANATCFDDSMIKYISDYPVKSGTIGITTTKRLLKTKWELLSTFHKPMTWGKARVFVHIKKQNQN